MRQQVIDPHVNFSCGGCTNCCTQPYAVIIEKEKAAALEQHDFSSWPQLQGRKLFSDDKDAPEGYFVLSKQPDSTRCVFLADDGLCIIHKELGAEAKPTPCRKFPYHVSSTYTEDRVSLDFGCPTVQKNEGTPLVSQIDDIRTVAPPREIDLYPDVQIALTEATKISQDEYNALVDRLESVFSAPGEQSIWMRFAEALSLVEAVESEKQKLDEDLADMLRAGAPAVDSLTVPDVEPYESGASAPSPVRMQFASTLMRDVLPPEVTLNLSLWKRVMLLPKLMPLARLTGSYNSKLLGHEIDFDAVLNHPLQPDLDPLASFLLQRYYRTRLWQRFLVGTRLSVSAGLHQHILDLNAILFLSRAMAHHEGARQLTQPLISRALSCVELNIANQPRMFGQKSLEWFTGQLDSIDLARESLCLMALPKRSDACDDENDDSPTVEIEKLSV